MVQEEEEREEHREEESRATPAVCCLVCLPSAPFGPSMALIDKLNSDPVISTSCYRLFIFSVGSLPLSAAIFLSYLPVQLLHHTLICLQLSFYRIKPPNCHTHSHPGSIPLFHGSSPVNHSPSQPAYLPPMQLTGTNISIFSYSFH